MHSSRFSSLEHTRTHKHSSPSSFSLSLFYAHAYKHTYPYQPKLTDRHRPPQPPSSQQLLPLRPPPPLTAFSQPRPVSVPLPPDLPFSLPSKQYSRYDGRVIVATHVAATGDSAGGGDCAVDHADATTAAVCFKNYFRISPYIVRSVFVLCNSARRSGAQNFSVREKQHRNAKAPGSTASFFFQKKLRTSNMHRF